MSLTTRRTLTSLLLRRLYIPRHSLGVQEAPWSVVEENCEVEVREMGDKVGNGLREELAEDATPFCTGPGKILPTSLNAEERVVFAHVLEVLHPTAKLGGRQGEVRLNVGTEVVVLVDESDVVARGVVVPVTQRAVSATSTQLCGFANSPRAEAFGGSRWFRVLYSRTASSYVRLCLPTFSAQFFLASAMSP